jgi:methylmalonyl-CoA mutase
MAAAVAVCDDGASAAEVCRCLRDGQAATRGAALVPEREGAPFEELRAASDGYRRRHGAWPRIFVARIGPMAEHRAREEYVRNVLMAGGFETIWSDGGESPAAVADACAASGAAAAVICGADDRYPEHLPETARALKESGAASVVAAGRPGAHEAAWRAAGVDAFLVKGDDLVELLGRLQEAAEVHCD